MRLLLTARWSSCLAILSPLGSSALRSTGIGSTLRSTQTDSNPDYANYIAPGRNLPARAVYFDGLRRESRQLVMAAHHGGPLGSSRTLHV